MRIGGQQEPWSFRSLHIQVIRSGWHSGGHEMAFFKTKNQRNSIMSLLSFENIQWERATLDVITEGLILTQGWMEAKLFCFFLVGKDRVLCPERPAWWITSELHTLISSLLYQSLGVNSAPAFKLPDTTLRLCVTMQRRDLRNILMSGVKGPLIKTLAHTVTPSL